MVLYILVSSYDIVTTDDLMSVVDLFEDVTHVSIVAKYVISA